LYQNLGRQTQVILDLEGKLFQSQESLNQKIIGEETERKQYRYEINRLEEEVLAQNIRIKNSEAELSASNAMVNKHLLIEHFALSYLNIAND